MSAQPPVIGEAVRWTPQTQLTPGPRWPTWPSEVALVGAPLVTDETAPQQRESARSNALGALERYPSALITPYVLRALGDSAESIRRDALRLCYIRRLLACVPQAATMLAQESSPIVRIGVLRVLALHAADDPDLQAQLLAALRDPDENTRAEAAFIVAAVPWHHEQHARVRTALIAKLVDATMMVRRAAVRSLGLLGPAPAADPNAAAASDPAAIAVARVLADPDPQVRQDAAIALGQLRDPRSGPVLIRAIDSGDEIYVSRAMLAALVNIPTSEVDSALLRMLDTPPRGLTTRSVSETLRHRPTPSPALVNALVERLGEPALRDHLLEILLFYGDAAAPALRVALERGLDPGLAVIVTRLLGALAPPRPAASATTTVWPAADQAEAWQARLAQPREREVAALALGRADPPWLAPAVSHMLQQGGAPALRRPWLIALAARPSPPNLTDPVAVAQLHQDASDPSLPVLDRCLALVTLQRIPRRKRQAEPAVRAASDPNPEVRGCAATLVTDESTLSALLHDEAPRVRAAAAWTIAACPRAMAPATLTQLAVLAQRDPHPGVALTAQAALADHASPGRCTWALHDAADLASKSASESASELESRPGWAALRWHGRDVLVPVTPDGAHQWLLLPGLAD